MKISSSNNINNIDISKHKIGKITSGKVLLIKNDRVLVNLDDGSILRAKLASDISLKENENILFTLKESDNFKLILSLINFDEKDNVIINENGNRLQAFINKQILKFNIDNKDASRLIDMYLDKITKILNIKEDEIIIPRKNLFKDNILDIKIDKLDNNYLEKNLELLDQTLKYKSEMMQIFSEKNKIIKMLAFLISNELEINFENLLLSYQFDNNINKIFDNILNSLFKENKFNTFLKNERNSERIIFSNLFNVSEEIINKIKNISLEDDIIISKSKEEFLKVIFDNFLIKYLPLSNDINNYVMIIKDKRSFKNQKKDKYNFKISVKTINLGLINIFCSLDKNLLIVEINVENRDIYKVFNENKILLANYLEEIGIKNKIRILRKDKNDNLDLFANFNSLDFKIDIRV